MRLFPRKVTLQLTPLLDLLLIVIFAQYLEMRDESNETRASAVEQSKQLRQAKDELKSARQKADNLAGKLSIAENDLADADKRNESQQSDLNVQKRTVQTLRDEQHRLRDQRDLLAGHLAKLFRLPEKELAKALKPLFAEDPERRAAELKKLQERIKKIQKSRPQQIVRHVVKFEELLKRCDIWEIHVDRRNQATISFNSQTSQFVYKAAPIRPTGDVQRDKAERLRYLRELTQDFERQLFSYYKGLPQTKNVIIVLLSYQSDRQFQQATFQAALDGIRRMADHVSSETSGRVHVFHVDLGTLNFEVLPSTGD